MGKNFKKLIAPCVIVLIIAVYMATIFTFALLDGAPVITKIAGLAVPTGIFGVSVFVLIERIGEIRSGEEDDLSNY